MLNNRHIVNFTNRNDLESIKKQRKRETRQHYYKGNYDRTEEQTYNSVRSENYPM